jgi:hypothetical protein
MRGIHSKFQLTKQTGLLNDDETLILDFFMIDIKISSRFNFFYLFFHKKSSSSSRATFVYVFASNNKHGTNLKILKHHKKICFTNKMVFDRQQHYRQQHYHQQQQHQQQQEHFFLGR